jgi:hypothetical protein
VADLEQRLRDVNRNMIAFDLALGSGALLAPDVTLAVLGHRTPSADARELFRRCGAIWLTFAAAHAVAHVRDEPRDWWAVAWLRGTEIATDVLWSRSAAFTRPGARAGRTWRWRWASRVWRGLERASRLTRPRARSSVGERSLHTREVAGSKPAAPTSRKPCTTGLLSWSHKSPEQALETVVPPLGVRLCPSPSGRPSHEDDRRRRDDRRMRTTVAVGTTVA